MATYCIGDIHGCCDEFLKMLDLIKFDDKSDELLLTGDLIGRGPYPVETMREIMSLGKCVKTVLGNHDINFLALHYGIVKARPKDNLEVMLNSPLRETIVNYFLKAPLLYIHKQKPLVMAHAGIYPLWSIKTAKKEAKAVEKVFANPLQRIVPPLLYIHKQKPLVMAHAGIYPLWSIKTAKKEAKAVEKVFANPLQRIVLLRNMYNEAPLTYSAANDGLLRWRFAINTFTRMRLCYFDGSMDYKNNAVSPEEVAKDGLAPWFSLSAPLLFKKKQYKLVFGHWAALNGNCHEPHIRALDTGCVWGDRLCAWRYEDDTFFYVKSTGYADI